MTDREIRDALAIYEIIPNDKEVATIRTYVAILLKWNRSIGLTSITDPIEIVGRHFGESMYASKFLPVENCRLADVGSGAGFPGLALKIAATAIRAVLIEANKKKCAFLFEVIRALELQDVEVRSERFEHIRPETVAANIITARAVGEFKEILHWAEKALADRGHLILWVGADDATRIASTPGWIWLPATHLPDSQRRYILVGRPVGASSAAT